MQNNELSLIYIWDAYCGWCYGFSKSLHAFHNNHLDLPVQVLSGGLFVGERKQPISAFPHIPGANQRIAQMTGVEFGAAYEELIAAGTIVLDSEDAAIGFAALRALAPERELDLATALQKAFYVNGRNLSDPETYQLIAKDFKLDAQKLDELLQDEAIKQSAKQDFEQVAAMGVGGYPALLLRKGNQLYQLGAGAVSVEKLESAFAALV